MSTKFYADNQGRFIGAFSPIRRRIWTDPVIDENTGEKIQDGRWTDGALEYPDLPEGAVEVPAPPEDARQIWDGSSWGTIPEDVTAARTLAETDGDMIRVIDDLVAALKSKGVIEDSDLPQAARDRLAERKSARSKL